MQEHGPSVVIARLEEINAVAAHEINDSVLLREPARPGIGSQVLEWLWLANPGEWIP